MKLLLAAVFLFCILEPGVSCKRAVGAGSASIRFASYYGDHMVLQKAPKRSTVWGYSHSSYGNNVNVTLSGNEPIKADVSPSPIVDWNIWKAVLPAETGPGPFTVTATGFGDVGAQSAEIRDVLFGDVWLCSGQSNMQFTLSMVFNSSEEIADAENYPNIRLFTAAMKLSNEPLADLIEVEEYWTLPNKDAVGHSDWTYFSAVCWLYGKYLYQRLNYPIGLISTTWGGTPIEAWSSPDALHACDPPTNGQGNSSPVSRHTQSDVTISPNDRSVLWNAMIHPFLDLTIYGAIWYQGESNAGAPDIYKCRFKEMIRDWRTKFNDGSGGHTDIMYPFGFVQLAPWKNDSSIVKGFPDIRWHQTYDYGYVPNTDMPNVFMAVAMDLPDFASPYNSIHPRDKQDVAQRLVLSAMSVAYNRSAGRYQGPMISAIYNDIRFFDIGLTFDDETSELDVRVLDGFEVCCSHNNQSQCNGTDSKWIPAPIILKKSHRVTVTYKDGCTDLFIVGLRYAWRESPCASKKCAIYSVENSLPAPPFKTIGLIR